MATAKKVFKLDLQEVLAALDSRDKGYYLTLPDDGKRALVMGEVALRWLSCVGEPDWDKWNKQGRQKGDGKGPPPQKDSAYTEYYLVMTNEGPNINMGYHELSKSHKELEWLLLTIVGIGKKVNHSWISVPSSETPTIDALIRNKYPLSSKKEVEMMKRLMSKDEIIDLVKGYGNPDKLSSTEASKSRNIYGGVFDMQTVNAELKKLKKI